MVNLNDENSQTDHVNAKNHYTNGDHSSIDGETEKAGDRLTGTTEPNPELDKRLNWKFDFHVVPWLCGLWLLAFIDRAKIGNAAVVGLE